MITTISHHYVPDTVNEMLMDEQIENTTTVRTSIMVHTKLQFNHAMYPDKKIMLNHFKSLIDNLK